MIDKVSLAIGNLTTRARQLITFGQQLITFGQQLITFGQKLITCDRQRILFVRQFVTLMDNLLSAIDNLSPPAGGVPLNQTAEPPQPTPARQQQKPDFFGILSERSSLSQKICAASLRTKCHAYLPFSIHNEPPRPGLRQGRLVLRSIPAVMESFEQGNESGLHDVS